MLIILFSLIETKKLTNNRMLLWKNSLESYGNWNDIKPLKKDKISSNFKEYSDLKKKEKNYNEILLLFFKIMNNNTVIYFDKGYYNLVSIMDNKNVV